MMLAKIKAITVIVSFTLLSVLLAESIYTVHVTRPKLLETEAAVNDMAVNLRDYAKDQTEDLRSPRNQKMLEHYLQIGEASLLTIQKINRTTVPALTGAANEMTARLHGLEPLELQLTRAASNAADLVADLNTQVVDHLLPETTALLTKLGLTADDLRTSIKIAFDQALLSLEDIHKLASDPKWQQILVSVAEGVQHLNGTTEQVEIASRNLPQIAASLAKIAKSGATFNKLIAIARILSLIVPLL